MHTRLTSRSAASYSVPPGLKPPLQTAASADTTEAAVAFTAEVVPYRACTVRYVPLKVAVLYVL
jgi:hypothetical protein